MFDPNHITPYSNSIGVVVSTDGGFSFERMFEGPIVDRNAWEPYFTISPWVLRDGGIWHMWYVSGTGWITVNDVPEPLYVIKYAHSSDGIVWQRDNITCIPPLTPHEANARPAVIRGNDRYKMWFCYRGCQDFRDGSNSYRIGYAEADNPVDWVRDDAKAELIGTPEGWDSRMQTYPGIIAVDGNNYMSYNGNRFGVAGFVCAVFEKV